MPRFLPLAVLVVFASAGRADLPSPRLDRLTPMGAAAGSTVDVEFAGADLEEPKALRFDHRGITATIVKDRTFKVSVASDVPAGTYDARVVGKYGVSSPRLFAVSHGLTEVVKEKRKSEGDPPQAIALNSVVNGQTDGNREDVYRVTLKPGQRVVAWCDAQALDATLDATLTVTTADGRPIAANADHAGRDPLVDFTAPSAGDYLLTVADLSFRGGLPYRLTITDRPHVETVFPRAIQAGQSADFTIYGQNLGAGAKPSAWRDGDRPFDQRTERVTAPTDLAGGFRFTHHPTTHSVLPTASTGTLAGFQVRGVPVLVSDSPVSVEQEPNDDAAKPQQITVPAVVSGRFDRERDADWYAFTPPADGAYAFDVYCERIAGRADPYLVVVDEKDNRVGELDDYGHRIAAFDGHLRDPHGTITLSAKKTYRILVQDRYRRGGGRYHYVLSVRKAGPGVAAAVIHPQNPGPGGVMVRAGGAQYLDLILHHTGGETGPVTVVAEGLPKGLHVTPTSVPNDTRGTVVLWADANAPAFVGPIKLFAETGAGDTRVRSEVRPYTRVESQQNIASSRPTRELVVAVLPEPPPFAVAVAGDAMTVEAGKKVEAKLTLTRGGDFKGPVTVTGLSLPGPIKVGQVTVAEGRTEATVTFEIQNGARPGVYTVALLGQGQVPFTKDPVKPKANTLVSLPSRPVTLTVTAAPAKK